MAAADGVYIAAGIGPDGEVVPLRVDATGKPFIEGGGGGGDADLSDTTPQPTAPDSDAGVGPAASRDDHVHRLGDHEHSNDVGDGGNVPAENIAGLAPVAVSGAATDITGLATVAQTGDYDDLLNRPTLDDVAESGDYNDLINTPVVSFAIIRDEKPTDTHGGGLTANTWTQRDLNQVAYDPDGIVTLAANKFTLQPGTYKIHVRAPSLFTNGHKIRLFNVTDNLTVVEGDNAHAQGPGNAGTQATLTHAFTLATAKQFRIDHIGDTTQATVGLGASLTTKGTAEHYTIVEITKGPGAQVPSAPVNPQTIVVLQDNFNRPDSAAGTVGAPQIGTRPYTQNAVWGITGNQLRSKVSAAAENLVVWGTGTTQYTMEFTIANIGTDSGAIFRAEVGYGGSWWFLKFGATQYHLYFHTTNGAYSLVATGTVVATNGDVVRIEVDEVTIRTYVNNALDISVDNSTDAGVTAVGFRSNSDSAVAIDNLTVTAVVDVALEDVLSDDPPATVGTANSAGVGTESSRDDHVHALSVHDHSGVAGHGGAVPYTSVTGLGTAAHTNQYDDLAGKPVLPDPSDNVPEDITTGAGNAGVSPDYSRADHIHHGASVGGGGSVSLSNANPQDVGDAPAPGSSPNASRADHVHDIGDVEFSITNIVDGPTVITTGDYNDLINKPTIPDPAITAPAATGHDGVAIIGSSPTFARADHVHPDTDYLGALVLLEEHVAVPGTTQLAFTNWLSADYDDYVIEIVGALPQTDAVSLNWQVSTDHGVTWDTAGNYFWSWVYTTNTNALDRSRESPGARFSLFDNVANTLEGLSGSMKLFRPANTAHRKSYSHSVVVSQSGAVFSVNGGGIWNNTAAYNAFRLLWSAGNFAEGRVRIYGISAQQPVSGVGHASLYAVETSTPNIVAVPDTANTQVPDMALTLPASTTAKAVILNASVGFSKVSGALHYGVMLDGVVVWPKQGGATAAEHVLATMGDGSPPQSAMHVEGCVITIPGDNATHTLTLFYNDSGPQTQAVFYKRSMTALLMPTATGPWNIGSTPAVAAITARISHTYTLAGLVDVASGDLNYINPFVVSIPAGQIVKLVGYSGKLRTGTDATMKLTKNGVDITGYTGLAVDTTRDTAYPATVTLADGDELDLVVTAITGQPANLSFSIFLEYTGVPA